MTDITMVKASRIDNVQSYARASKKRTIAVTDDDNLESVANTGRKRTRYVTVASGDEGGDVSRPIATKSAKKSRAAPMYRAAQSTTLQGDEFVARIEASNAAQYDLEDDFNSSIGGFPQSSKAAKASKSKEPKAHALKKKAAVTAEKRLKR
jgi:hypothetical protein